MKQHLQSIIEKLSQEDINLIKALIKGEFRDFKGKYQQSIGLITQLQDEREIRGFRMNESVFYSIRRYCKIFRTGSIQEIIRKLLYYKIFSIKVSEQYLKFLNEYSNERYFALMQFRREIFRFFLKFHILLLNFVTFGKTEKGEAK